MPAAALLILALAASTPSPLDAFEVLPVPECFERLALDPSNPNVLFGYSFDPARLHRSDDGGVTWSKLTAPGHRLASIVVSPAISSTVYAVANGFYVSHDRGQTWTKPDGAPTDLNGRLIVDPFLPEQLYIANNAFRGETVFGEIWFSADEGIHWTRRDQGIPLETPPSDLSPVVADPRRPGVFLVSLLTAVYATSDSGENWTLQSANPVNPVGFDAGSSDVVWGLAPASPAGSFPAVSMDGGRNWSPRPIPRCFDFPRTLYLRSLVPDPVSPGVAYAALAIWTPFLYRDDLLQTSSHGLAWTSLRGGGTYPPAGFQDIAIDPIGPRIWVAACDGNSPVVYRRGPRPTIDRSPVVSPRGPRPTIELPVR